MEHECKKKRSFIITKFEHLLCAGSDDSEQKDTSLQRLPGLNIKRYKKMQKTKDSLLFVLLYKIIEMKIWSVNFKVPGEKKKFRKSRTRLCLSSFIRSQLILMTMIQQPGLKSSEAKKKFRKF